MFCTRKQTIQSWGNFMYCEMKGLTVSDCISLLDILCNYCLCLWTISYINLELNYILIKFDLSV